MTSVSGTKKVVKAGSSDVITVTKDISKLGISAGDEVVIFGGNNLRDGEAVTVRN